MQFPFQQFFGWRFSKELSLTNAGVFQTQQFDTFRGLVCTRGTLFLCSTFCALLTGFGLPANVDTWQNSMLVPELKSCVTLLDETNEVVARLGQAIDRLNEIKDLRGQPDKWLNLSSCIHTTPASLRTATYSLQKGEHRPHHQVAACVIARSVYEHEFDHSAMNSSIILSVLSV